MDIDRKKALLLRIIDAVSEKFLEQGGQGTVETRAAENDVLLLLGIISDLEALEEIQQQMRERHLNG